MVTWRVKDEMLNREGDLRPLHLTPQSRDFVVFAAKMIVAFAYVAALDFAYRAYLPKFWSDWGFVYFPKPTETHAAMFLVGLIPALWTRSINTRPSTLFQLIIYIIVFVPTIVVSYNVSPSVHEHLVTLWLSLVAGSAIIAIITNGLPMYLARVEMARNHRTVLMAFVFLLLFGLVIYGYGSSIDILSFRDIYKHRIEVAKQEAFAPAVYSYWWLSGAILPLGLVWSIHYRRPLLFIGCFAAQIIMFGVSASKSAGLTAFVTPVFYLFACVFQRWFGVALLATVAMLVAAAGLFTTDQGLVGVVTSTLLARTLGIPGITAMQYDQFFSEYGYTYWSHINFVRLFIDYPYFREIPYEVGTYFYNNDLLSWNANFWASDGIAAFGLPGVLIVSVLAGIVFRVLDQSCRHLDPRLTAAWALTPAMALSNIGLFTCLLTDGLGVMILIAFILPPMTLAAPQSKHTRRPAPKGVTSFGGETAA